MHEGRLIWLLIGLLPGLMMGAVLGLLIPRSGRYAPLSNPGATLVLDTTTGQVWELSRSDRVYGAKWTAAPALPRLGSAQGNEGEKVEPPATNPAGETAAPSASAFPTRTVPPPPPGPPAAPPPGKAPPAPPWQAPPVPPATRR